MAEELKGKETCKAFVQGGGVSETKAGKPQAFISLMDEHSREWVWTGSFNEGKAREITMAALQSAGFSGSISDLAIGKGFEKNKEVNITIDDKWNEDNTKSYRAVAWINGQSKASVLMGEADALLKMKSMGLDADFAAMFSGGTANSAAIKTATAPDNVPF